MAGRWETVYRVYDYQGIYRGFFLGHEEELAKKYAQDCGGQYVADKAWFD